MSTLRKLIFLALTVSFAAAASFAQPNRQVPGERIAEPLPRLCRPVAYRQPSQKAAPGIRVAMLEDRQLEVGEALAGWADTGVPLVGRFDGQWEPVPCGDDTGLFYLVPLLARHAKLGPDQALDVFLVGLLAVSAALGALGLCLTVCKNWQRCLGLVPILLGSFLAFKKGDVYLVQASAVLMLLPWMVYSLKAGVAAWRRFCILFSCGLVLGVAQWVRTQSALPLLIFLATLLWFSPLRRRTRLLLFAATICGMCLPLLYAQLPLQARDRFLTSHQPGYSTTLNRHVFWHTAYLGLAYLENPYVPAWRDSVAVSFVESVDPHALYGGAEYESILRSRVQQIARQNPWLIVETAVAKTGVIACLLLLCINVGLVAAALRPKPLGTELAFWLSMAFAALPGIVALPLPQYIIGMLMVAFYYWFYSLAHYLEHRSAERAPIHNTSR